MLFNLICEIILYADFFLKVTITCRYYASVFFTWSYVTVYNIEDRYTFQFSLLSVSYGIYKCKYNACSSLCLSVISCTVDYGE